MKVVYAATVEQEAEVDKLLYCLRHEILPSYISDMELNKYDELGLLKFQEQSNLYNGTRLEAFQVMAALQVICLVISEPYDSSLEITEKQRVRFDENKEILKYYGLFFPFEYEMFTKSHVKGDFLPSYFSGEDILIV